MIFGGRNLPLRLQELASRAGQGSINLETLHKGGGSHELHLRHLGLQAQPTILVEKDLAVHLFSHLALVPLLLLLPAACQGSSELLLLGLLLNLRSLLAIEEMMWGGGGEWVVCGIFSFSSEQPSRQSLGQPIVPSTGQHSGRSIITPKKPGASAEMDCGTEASHASAHYFASQRTRSDSKMPTKAQQQNKVPDGNTTKLNDGTYHDENLLKGEKRDEFAGVGEVAVNTLAQALD